MALLRATLSAVFALMVIAAAANAASISHGHVHEMQKQKHGRTTVAVRRALGARVLRARAAVGFTPEEGISTGESMYFYPRPDVCFNKPSRTQQRGELPLDNVCAAVVDILAAAASNVNAMAGVAITDNGYVVVALSGTVGNPAKTFDDNDLQWMADEMKKVEPLMKLFGSFDRSHIINLNAPNAQWHHLSQLLTAVGTEIGVPGGNHAADSACPNDRLGHTAYRAFPGANLPRTEVVWSNGGGNGAGDRLARVYAHNGGVNVANPYGACAGTKLIAFEALSGLTYKCMAERKTQQRGYRASCLTCQEVIPQLRGGATHRQVERFKANLKAACTGIDQVPLLTATNDEQNALAALQQAKLQRTQLEADVTLRTQAYDLMMSTVQQVVGMEPNLDKRQKLIKAQYEQAVAALRDDQQVKRIPELENAHRVAAVRLQIITLHGALQAQALAAECDLRIKNARAFALY